MSDPKPPCPACGSADVLPFLYGEPADDVKGSMMAPRPDDEVALGGCMFWPESPAWKCRGCGREFGALAEVRPEMFSRKERDDG